MGLSIAIVAETERDLPRFPMAFLTVFSKMI